MYKIFFLEDQFSYFYYTNTHDECLPEALKWVNGEVGDDEIIAFNFGKGRGNASIFQIGTSTRILLIKCIEDNCVDCEVLKSFIINHKFIGKKVGEYKKLLVSRINLDAGNIYEIDNVYLRPNNLPIGYIQMCYALGVKSADKYMNKKARTTAWDAPDIPVQQILYEAFEIVGIYGSFVNAKARFPTALEEMSMRALMKENKELKKENEKLKKVLSIVKQVPKKEE